MLRNNRAQVALMFIVAIAIGLVFMAMVMNWNRAVQVKTQAQVATTTTAASLVSRLASYGQNLMETSLKGQAKYCDQNGILGIIIMIVIIIVLIVVTIISCGGAAAAWAAVLTSGSFAGAVLIGLTIALVLTIGTLALQVAYIQPQITRLWNKMQQNISTVEDQFLEAAIQNALMLVVNDSETIPDLLDYNMNGKWNIPGVPGSDPKERVSRLVYHNTERLRLAALHPGKFQVFVTRINDFVRDLGLTSSLEGTCCTETNVCNETCQFASGLKSEEQPALATGTQCAVSPYQGYPFSYDPLRCMSSAELKLDDPSLKTIAGLLGRERVMLTDTRVPAHLNDNAAEARGPLFRFLWYLKGAVDDNNDEHAQNSKVSLFVFNGSRQALKYFYDGNGTTDCPPLTLQDPGTSNYWRPGNNLFCSENNSGDFFSAPHDMNCSFCPAKGECTCAAATYKTLWKDDAFDQDVASLHAFWALMRKLDGPAGKIVFEQNAANFAVDFKTTLLSTNVLKANMIKIREVLKASGLASVKDADLSGKNLASADQLLGAKKEAVVLLNNIDTALKAFACEAITDTAALAECNDPLKGKGDRVTYLNYLLDQYNADKSDPVPAIGPYAIYGWQSAGVGKERGYRHLVKIEVAVPKRCRWWTNERGNDIKNSCGVDRFPWIKTEKTGMTRCYWLEDPSGCVKVRITRWDEDRISKMLSFVSGLELWTVLSGHPAYEGRSKPKDLEACFNRDKVTFPGGVNGWIPDPSIVHVGQVDAYYVPESFMINNDDSYANRYGLDCASAVNTAVHRGFVTEVCAKYYTEAVANDPENKVYKMKFIPCNQACK